MWKILKWFKKEWRKVKCRCNCWIEKYVNQYDVLNWKSTNCWCVRIKKRIELNKKHNMCWTPFYEIWRNIKSRCNNKNNKDYWWRWIINEWNNFEEFKKAMYEKFLEHYKNNNKNTFIDRKNNNWNYNKNNCRFVTRLENNRNRRNTRRYKWKTIWEWSEKTWIPYWTLKSRIDKNYNFNDVINLNYKK